MPSLRLLRPACTLRALMAAALTLALPALTVAVPPQHAAAQGFGGVKKDMVRAQLLGGWQRKNGHQMAALRLDLAPGWKTYWRAPGDAGIPPTFDWSGSENVAAISLHWPVPHVFELNGMRSIGYKQALVLPVEVTPRDPSKPVLLKAKIDIGVCKDICVPVTLDSDAQLPRPGRRDPVIEAALRDQPRPVPGGAPVRCTLKPDDRGLELTASLALPPPRARSHPVNGAADTGEVMVIETGDPTLWVSEPQTERSGNVISGTADLIPNGDQMVALDRSKVRVTVLGGDGAVEATGCQS